MVFKCSQRRDNFPRKFEKKGSANGELSWPVSISVDCEDVVYVADDDNYCVSVFTGM